MVAIDTHAETSHPVLHFAMRHAVRKEDTLHLISVLPLSGEMTEPMSNVLDAPAPLWSGQAWKKEREASELVAIEALKSAHEICRTYQVGQHTYSYLRKRTTSDAPCGHVWPNAAS